MGVSSPAAQSAPRPRVGGAAPALKGGAAAWPRLRARLDGTAMDPPRRFCPPGPGPGVPMARGLRGLAAFSPRLPAPRPAQPPPEPSPFPAMFRALGLEERPVERPLGRGGAGGEKAAAPSGPVQLQQEEEEKGPALAALPTRGQILWRGRGIALPPKPGKAPAVPALCPPGPQPCPTPVPTLETPQAAARPTQETKPAAKGATVPLGLNFVKIHCQNEAVYQYHVTFSPEVECRSARFALLKEQHAVTGDVTAFDGSILYLPIRIPKVTVKARRKDGEEISINIQMTKVLEPSSDLCVPFYNVVFRRVMKILNMSLVKRHFFEPAQATSLQKYSLHIWPGYAVSIRRKDGGLFLMVDAIHKIIRSESVLSMMKTIHSQNQRTFQDECIKQLVGSVVMTRYNYRTYRVDDIDWDRTPKDTFTTASGQEMTFMEYYRKNYGVTIRELDQPLLVHKPKEKLMPHGGRQLDLVLLVPELSFLTGMSDLRKNSRMLKEVMREMVQSPQQHYQRLTGLLRRIRDSPDASRELQLWGLCLDTDIFRTQGHVLPVERINLRHRSFLPAEDLGWHREVAREVPIAVVSLNSWVLIYPKRLQHLGKDLLAAMRSSCGALGMQVGQPTVRELHDDRIETYVRIIQSSMGSQDNVQLLLFIIPGGRDDIYRAIKKLCCVQTPVPTQVINSHTLSGHPGKIRSVVHKVLLQINCKLGGQLWGVDIPLKQLMVVGMDIHHSRSQGMRSVIGFVASMNQTLTKWYSRVAFQMPHQEIADSLRICLSQALRRFYERNHSLPMKIVVYRDGVSDPQLDTVLKYEVPQLQKSFQTFQSYQPSLVVVVVQKQLSTNFYSLKGEEFVSPPMGTVIDHSITSPDGQDFFLLAHHSHQGCSVPTRYTCVWNTASLSSEHLQRLTFKLCHLYWNWPGTVRVPAPCKYAHRLALMVGQILHQEPSAHLIEQLFFL
ncbi:piwi-like protein 2 [Prinia subflava]|uniref:piwi-like protein 2 n=1 Tax=Prinia subflava TaxID=208062 RepID=UPI002FE1E2C0